MNESKTTFTTSGDREIVMERVFDAPPNDVYKKMTDAHMVPHWWGPAVLTTTVETMDVRLGGTWRFVQRDKDGKEFAFHGEYTDIVPNERLSYTFIYEGMPGDVMMETVDLTDMEGQTKVRIVDTFESEEQRDGMLKSGMEAGATESMERFSKLLEPAMIKK